MGHVLNISIQDVLVRRARMQGKNTLWLPGMDHASIATEAQVTRMLKSQGINKRKIGRGRCVQCMEGVWTTKGLWRKTLQARLGFKFRCGRRSNRRVAR